MVEVWKDIAGYEGLYQVSNTGKVRSIDRYVMHKRLGKKFCGGRLIAPHTSNNGYATVNLCKENKYKSHSVHRLVAIAFIPTDNVELVEVNHIDENKQNNDVENLEWVTKSQNNHHGTKRQRQAVKIKQKILQCSTKGEPLKEWESATDAEKFLCGKFTGAISHCLNGKTKSAYGYMWKFKEPD